MSRELYYGYASLGDLVNRAAVDPSEMTESARHSRRGEDGGYSWAGTATWEQAKKLGMAGDVEGARRLAPKMLEAVNSIIHNQPRLDPVYRLDEGRWIDVARFVKGEPECWGDMVEAAPSPRKGAAVVINSSYNGGVSAEAIDRVGVAVGSAVLGLQAQGYAVTVYAALRAEPSGDGRKYGSMTIHAPINPGGAPLDVSQLSVVLRPWFLRRIIFSIMETYAADVRRAFGTGSGYGRPSRLTTGDLLKITGVQNAVSIDIGAVVNRPESVAANIIRQIKGA